MVPPVLGWGDFTTFVATQKQVCELGGDLNRFNTGQNGIIVQKVVDSFPPFGYFNLSSARAQRFLPIGLKFLF
jgi:hypothetical protein